MGNSTQHQNSVRHWDPEPASLNPRKLGHRQAAAQRCTLWLTRVPIPLVTVYTVLGDALTDLASTFSASPLVHLGFDEVNQNCWLSDASVTSFMKAHNLTLADLLHQFFVRERQLLTHSNKSAVYWDEVLSSAMLPLPAPTSSHAPTACPDLVPCCRCLP